MSMNLTRQGVVVSETGVEKIFPDFENSVCKGPGAERSLARG